jgi:hypothetical protein
MSWAVPSALPILQISPYEVKSLLYFWSFYEQDKNSMRYIRRIRRMVKAG